MWHRKTVAVIFPTYREKDSIKDAILEFDSTGFVDEIIVVDNNAQEGTGLEVKKTRARLIKDNRQGYGRAIKTGIKNTKADLLIIAEPDGAFEGKDVVKLLAYSDDFDTVFGSRTHVPLIHSGAGMHFLRRILDVLLGKMISILFMSTTLTDVGCVLRLTNRRGWKKVSSECKADNAMFATEWLLLACKNNVKFIEIPVNFRSRVGRPQFNATFFGQAIWGVRIFIYIWKVWFYAKLDRKLR
ncbi:glycosyltransferase family 2 protein [Candidatus Daviesbacteria bacterium]|nr:glycosyltransferase family 2 protein [Candidatus Daviesbacteria bacterium]